SWDPIATRVSGIDATGISPADLVFTPDRTLVVNDATLELWPNPLLLDLLMDLAQGFLHPAQLIHQDPIATLPPVSKKSATVFSIPGPSSDVLHHVPNARFLLDDSGKRYDFTIDGAGKVSATHPDGTVTALGTTRSYNELRVGHDVAAPPFDL